jgi:histidine ammonia-lyase
MVICNSLGAVVKEIELASKNGTVIIGGSEFSDGLYFVSIEEQGQVYQTQRLIIQK